MVPRHFFTARIEEILQRILGPVAADVFVASPLLGYLNHKTKAAARGSKARGAFANHYALYVLVEDYISKGYAPGGHKHGTYQDYEGARFSDLFKRQRELPFGQKLQNHALNTRLNDEFRKFYPSVEVEPIVRDVESQRYWIHEDLLTVEARGPDGTKRQHNIATAIIQIIDAYVAARLEAFESFVEVCKKMGDLAEDEVDAVVEFIRAQLAPNVDARIFEIVSFAVLNIYYSEQTIVWGWSRDALNEEALSLYKTGRTNANDGGIDFVMRPLGRFFQVTETIDVNKYFLDIDKVQRFPLTFVVKSNASTAEILDGIRQQAIAKYRITAVVDGYMRAVEEVINVPILLERLQAVLRAGRISAVMQQIIIQSKVEFNYEESDASEAEASD